MVKRAGLPGAAAAMILLGLLLLDWAVIDQGLGISLRLSPRGDELCVGHACRSVRWNHAGWPLLSRVALGLGALTAVGLAGVAIVRGLGGEPGRLGRIVVWACLGALVAAVMAMIGTGGSLGDLGAGGVVTVVGAALGAGSQLAARSAGAFDGGRAARPIRSTATAPAASAPAPRPAPTARDLEPERRPVADVSATPSKVARLGPAAPVAADATRGALRFVVADGALTTDGLTVRFDRGGPRTIAWADVVEVVARRMPPDPPYDKTAFVDLVLADGTPARLLPSTRLDLAALPGGIAPNTRENWRRLVALARARNPAIAIEAESADFFAGGRDPVMFPALKLFAAWDRRYG